MRSKSLTLLIAIGLPLCNQVAFGQPSRADTKASGQLSRHVHKAKDYDGPVTVGPFSIDNHDGGIALRKLLLVLAQRAAPRGEDVCYHDGNDTQLVVERGADNLQLVRGLTLSRINVCPANSNSQASGFSSWKTEKGVRLGSGATDVLSAYGKPSSVWDMRTERGFVPYPKEGDRSRMTSQERILVYLPRQGAADTSHAFFGIRSGVVVWMTVSDNE